MGGEGPGGPDGRWSGQQPAVAGGPGDPDGRWSGQHGPVGGWDDDGGPVSGRQPAAARWQGPASGRGPAVPGAPPGPPGAGLPAGGRAGGPPGPDEPAGPGEPYDAYAYDGPEAHGGDGWGAPPDGAYPDGAHPDEAYGAADAWGAPPADDPYPPSGPRGAGWGQRPGPAPAGRGPAAPGSPEEWEQAEAELAARLEQQHQQQPPDPWEQVQPDRMWRRRTGPTRAVSGELPSPEPGPVPVPAEPTLPPIDPETRLWSARYLCDRLATEQRAARRAGRPFSLVLVQVPDGPLAALSYRRQVTLLRELGHQFVAGGLVDHLVHVPDQVQHWFAVILPDTDRASAQAFERRLRNGIGGYLRSRGLLLGELQSACLTSPDDDEALGVIWDTLIARGQPSPSAAGAPPR